jgi:TonB family protein
VLLVRWIGEAPPEKGEWQEALRRALADPSGQHRVRLWRGPSGWRFDVGRRTRAGWDDDAFGRAGVDVVRRVRDALAGVGAELDPTFDPSDPTEPGPPAPDAAEPPPPPWRSARHRGRVRRWLAVSALAAGIGLLAWRALQEPVVTPPLPGADPVAMRERVRELEDEVARLQQQKAAEAVLAPDREPSRAPRPAPARRATPAPPVAPATPVSVPSSTPATIATPVPTTMPTTMPPPPPTLASTVAPAPTPAPAPEPPAVEPGSLVDLADLLLIRPVLVSEDRPRYPPAAQRAGIEGSVVVSAVVTETGVIGPVTIVRASPRGLGFEDEALRFVRTRRYRPATRQGVPVRVRMEMIVEFRRPSRSR